MGTNESTEQSLQSTTLLPNLTINAGLEQTNSSFSCNALSPQHPRPEHINDSLGDKLPEAWTVRRLESLFGSPGGSVVKNPRANTGDMGSFPGREDALEKKMATCSSILAYRIPWIEEPGGLPQAWASLVAQMIKSLPAVWEIWVWSLGWEDPREKEMAIHSSILAWKIPWMEEPGV